MSKKFEDVLFQSVMADLHRAKVLSEEKVKKEQAFQALDWHSKQAVLFEYQPLNNLKASTIETFLNLQSKANKHDAIAQFEMGRYHAHGLFVAKNERIAQAWYHQSSNLGYIPAKYALASLLHKTDPKLALRLLEEAAEGNYAAAQNSLGMCYLRNQLVKPNYKNICIAFSLFQKAQQQGENKSVQGLIKCLKYFRQYHIPYPNEVDLSLLDEAFVVAPTEYPLAYRHAKDLRDAAPEEQIAIVKTAGLLLNIAKDIFAKRNLQNKKNTVNKTSQEKKEISAEDIKNAWKLLHEKKSSRNTPPSPALENCLFDAARCFLYGFQTKKNLDIGIQYCKAATILHFAPAQDFLASLYSKLASNNPSKEQQKMYYDEAHRLFTEAAYQGFAKGQCHLGLFYQQGLCRKTPAAGVPTLAYTWYMRAAHLGNEDAQRLVAECITLGYGIPADLREPVQAKRKPATAAATATAAVMRPMSATAVTKETSTVIPPLAGITATAKAATDGAGATFPVHSTTPNKKRKR